MKSVKKSFIKLLLIFCLALTTLTLVACIDNYGRPSDYVEVERLAIKSANVYLSPSGSTSTYQLEVDILPTNASNIKLDYYVPSEYLQYLRVSADGLLQATGQTPPEDLIIPVKVTSTTNKKATLTVNVKVEYVPVKYISFADESATLLMSDTYQVEPIFEPYHAQDGRSVSYSSTNEDVATVSSSGFVQPLKAGNTTILCLSTAASGRTVTGRFDVHVVYAPGKYRLDVSDPNPQYNQVLGDFKAIHFNLMSLDPNSDPNIRIQWYVNSRRVISLGTDSRQYEHIPDVESRTSYRIRVVIDPSKDSVNDPQQILESELISIYDRFQGFDLIYDNLFSSLTYNYAYGDTATFAITDSEASVVSYNWYLKKKNSVESGKLVATTPVDDRNLTRRLNVEGDFTLTAKSVGLDGNEGRSRDFDFSVTRFIVGDSIVVNPVLEKYGTPPETYNYFLTPCDNNGEFTGETLAIGHSSNGESFHYAVYTAGNYILSANATLNGTLATVPVEVDGKKTEKTFTYLSKVIRYYPSDTEDAEHPDDLVKKSDYNGKFAVKNTQLVTDVVISGIYNEGEYRVLLTWDAPLGIENYTVEIKCGDKVTLINEGVGFGNASYIVPNGIVGLQDSFTVRVKADGSLFSLPYHYNKLPEDGKEQYYFEKIPTTAYPYLTPVNGTITSYLSSMENFGDFLRYLTDYRPSGSNAVGDDGIMYTTLQAEVMTAFDLSDSDKYFDGEVPEGYPAELAEIYKATLGAQSVFCTPNFYRFSFRKLSDGGYGITVIIPENTAVLPTEQKQPSGYISPSYSKNPYGNNVQSHAIDERSAKPVADSEQLYYAVARGYKPAFTTDSVRYLYQKAVNVINGILDENMTDYEKVLAIFDYLSTNVKYDTATAELSAEGGIDFYNSAAFRLEGVFDYNNAVCDGISKAFVLLCSIEGIKCERVTGKINGATHAWNKVCVDGKYYVVDVTNGLSVGEELSPNYKFFMLSDEDYAKMFETVVEYGENPVCEESKINSDEEVELPEEEYSEE